MRNRPAVRRWLFLVIGLLVLSTAYFMTDPAKRGEFWPTTVQNVALIALTVVIVEFLWDLAGGDPVTEEFADVRSTLGELRQSIVLLGDSHRTGLRRIVAASVEVGNEFWRERIKSATRKVELMGYSLKVWTKTPNFERTVAERARAGVKFKLLLMAPDNRHIEAFVNTAIPGETVEGVRQNISDALAAFKAIHQQLAKAGVADKLEVRVVTNGLVVTQLSRFDDTLTAVQYLYSQVASRTPLLEVAGGKSELFRIYVQEFDELWDGAVDAFQYLSTTIP